MGAIWTPEAISKTELAGAAAVTALLPQGDISLHPPYPREPRGLIVQRGFGNMCAESYEPDS